MNQAIMNNNGRVGLYIERLFHKLFEAKGCKVERNDRYNKRNSDLLIDDKPVEIKARFTPFYKSEVMFGLLPNRCMTVDTDKLYSYIIDDINARLIYYVDYRPHFDTHGIFEISVNKLREICKKHPERRQVWMDYEKGREIERVYIGLDEMIDRSSEMMLHIFEAQILKKFGGER